MADSKKYDGSQWEHSLRKLITATETIQSGDTIYANGQPITAYTLKGNTVQNGTPSPQNPVMPQGTGNKTANLFSSVWEQGSIDPTGTDYPSDTVVRTKNYIPVTPNTIYSISRNIATSYMNLRFYDSNMQYIDRGTSSTIRLISGNSEANPMAANRGFCCFEIIDTNIRYMRINDNSNDASTKYMMVEGQYTASTIPTYEPYGIKIPISSASTTTPVYLGSVASTRKIKKYVFTGQEADLRIPAAITATNAIQAPTTMSDYEREPFICSHMQVTNSSSGSSTHGYYGQYLTLCFALSMGLDTLDKARTYLQQQYANGTPVTVWYVLSEPTTGIVNEPLMKIGDYADTLSNATSIPTTDGANSITVDTTVQPSEFTATWTGWHDSSVKEYDGTNWQ